MIHVLYQFAGLIPVFCMVFGIVVVSWHWFYEKCREYFRVDCEIIMSVRCKAIGRNKRNTGDLFLWHGTWMGCCDECAYTWLAHHNPILAANTANGFRDTPFKEISLLKRLKRFREKAKSNADVRSPYLTFNELLRKFPVEDNPMSLDNRVRTTLDLLCLDISKRLQELEPSDAEHGYRVSADTLPLSVSDRSCRVHIQGGGVHYVSLEYPYSTLEEGREACARSIIRWFLTHLSGAADGLSLLDEKSKNAVLGDLPRHSRALSRTPKTVWSRLLDET